MSDAIPLCLMLLAVQLSITIVMLALVLRLPGSLQWRHADFPDFTERDGAE